jgi:hypothetical protein
VTRFQRAKRLKGEVELWAAETRILVGACRLLLEYFGTKRELKSWDVAIEAPLRWVSAVVAHFSGPKRAFTPRSPDGRGPAFRCSEGAARILSPLAEIVGGPVAEFVYTIRRTYPRAEHSRHIFHYGMFSVSFADAVTHPLWSTYRHLAPDEWKQCFPAPPANRALQRTALARRR